MKKSRSDRQNLSPQPEPNPRTRQDVSEFEMARKHRERFDPKRWEAAMEFKRQMTRMPVGTPDPGSAVVQKLKAKDVGKFIGNENHKATVRASKNPQKSGSFGFVGSFATVAAKTPFVDGTLVLRFNRKKLGWINRESLRIFRWDEKAKQFFKVPGSSVSLEGDYVYARISRPGGYSIIGVNTYPTVYQTIKAFQGMDGALKALPPILSRAIRDRLCKVLLCDSGVARAMRDSRFLRELAREGASDGFPIPNGETGDLPGDSPLCEICLDLPELPPETQIVDEILPTGSACHDSDWESVGPDNMSGCIKQVMLDPNNSNRLYAAADDGGLWVLDRIDFYPLVDGWRPLTDQEEDLRIRAFAIAPSDSRIIYYANSLGYLYQSIDQGENWRRTSSTTLNVTKILIHHEDPFTVLVATSSGLFVSGDGGASWPFVWRRGEDVLDLAMDPQDSSIIYVAIRGVGVVKNYGLGFSSWLTILPWTAVTSGPAGFSGNTMIKIALGYQNADMSFQYDGNRRVAVKLSTDLWVNDRGGRGTWNFRGVVPNTGQGDWDNCVAIDPFDPSIILAGQQNLFRIADGDSTWASRSVAGGGERYDDQPGIEFARTHEDQQCIEFDRRHQGVVYSANDGGVFRSSDGGATWAAPRTDSNDDRELIANFRSEIDAKRSLNFGLVTAQFYRVGVHGNYAVGDAYHLGQISSPSLTSKKWRLLQGGDYEGAHVYADPKRPRRYYVFQLKYERFGRQRYPLSVTLEPHGADWLWYSFFKPYSGGAVASIAVDTRRDSETILVGAESDVSAGLGNRLMITKDGNKEPRNDMPDFPPRDDLPTWETAIENGADPIVSVVFASSTPGRAYAISDSGHVFSKEDVNADGGWLSEGRWAVSGVRQLAVDSQDDSLIYAITGDQMVRSLTGGESWADDGGISWPPPPPFGTGLPASEFNSIVTHPRDTFKLYLGADSGVYFSPDRATRWYPYDDGLPNAEVTQIFFQDHYLYAVTHGRGLWRRRVC